MSDENQKAEVVRLNDLARRNPPAANAQVVITPALMHELNEQGDWQNELVDKLTTFDKFTEDNDPYGEHDFGSFEVGTVKLFWKISYYDLNLSAHSEAEWDPKVTKRVVTLMLPSDY